jgi:CHAD domain-containing protein
VLVRNHVLALKDSLADVGPENERGAHAARIAAKRLRYLLEPLVRRAPRGKSLIGRLKELQDVLGDLHDVQILSQEIASSLELLSQNNPDARPRAIPGLLALQGMADVRAGTLYEQFQKRWADKPAGQFLERVAQFALTLGKPDAAHGETKKYPPLGIVLGRTGNAAGV